MTLSGAEVSIAGVIIDRLGNIPDAPGVIYALEFADEDLLRFARSGNILDAYMAALVGRGGARN